MIRFPIPEEELTRFRSLLPPTKPSRPYAFIYGHGLWNDLDLQATVDWLDKILDTSVSAAPWLSPGYSSTSSRPSAGNKRNRKTAAEKREKSGFWPRLILTPNAAGREKPDEWLVSQGNKALMIFEEAVGVEAGRRGVEHLGTWNMSIQSNKFDGVSVFPLFPCAIGIKRRVWKADVQI